MRVSVFDKNVLVQCCLIIILINLVQFETEIEVVEIIVEGFGIKVHNYVRVLH